MFNYKKLSDVNFSFAYTNLFSFKLLVVFGYIVFLLHFLLLLIKLNFFTIFIFFGFNFIVEKLVPVLFVLLFVFIIADIILYLIGKRIEDCSKNGKKKLFCVLNSFIFLYALWYLWFDVLTLLFLVFIVFLIKYLISKNAERKVLIISLGCLLMFLIVFGKGIIEGIIFDKGQWNTKYLFNNETIEKVDLLRNTDKVLFITKPNGKQSGIINQKLYIYDLAKSRFDYSAAFVNSDVSNDKWLNLNTAEILIINKNNIYTKSIINITIHNLHTKEIKNIKRLVRKNIGEQIIILKNGHILILPNFYRNYENYLVYNPYKNEFYNTKNVIEGDINISNIKTLENGDLLIPLKNKFYIYNLERNTFEKGGNININEKCALYKDEYIFDFQSGYKYSLIENKKTNIKKLKKFYVQSAIDLDNGNFLIIGEKKRCAFDIIGKHNFTGMGLFYYDTYKTYLYITKYDYYLQLKPSNKLVNNLLYSNFVKLENGDILFWNKKNNYITIYKYRKDK